jgi:hypothetical protein
LTRADAALLAALTESGARGVDLPSLLHDYDWLHRAIPTFDELRFGLPRLTARGFAQIGRNGRGELRFRATPSACDLRRRVDATRIGGVAEGLADLVGAPPPDSEMEDRSLGPLAGLRQDDLDSALASYDAWVRRWSRPLVAISRVVGWWVRRRTRAG